MPVARKKHSPKRKKQRHRRVAHNPPGSGPGLESLMDDEELAASTEAEIQVVDYGGTQLTQFTVTDIAQLRDGKPAHAAQQSVAQRPEWAQVRWIRVQGIQTHTVRRLSELFRLDSMACEDVIHLGQRPKLDHLDGYQFIVLRQQRLVNADLDEQQLSFFFRPDLLITFEEKTSDIWDSVLQRLQNPQSRLRRWNASYLLYALLDTVVDEGFPLLEHCEQALEDLELRVVGTRNQELFDEIYQLRRNLVEIRRVRWSMREISEGLQRGEQVSIAKEVRPYLKDVHDHVLLQLDMAESYREAVNSLTELYVAMMGHRMNEVMKVLTVIATIFIPITFLAGVYGMNFTHMPELDQRWAYPTFWVICLVMIGGLTLWFRRRGWW